MRALVTGAGGFVGRYLVDHLQERGDQVLGITLAGSGADMPCPVECFDITEAESIRRVFTAFKPEVIYHLAGIAFVPEAEEDFSKALAVNVLGTSNIYRVAHLLELGCKIVFISSAEVYGKVGAETLPISEQSAVAPSNNYSLSKAMAEMVAERYARERFIRSVIVRPFNHIGPGQDGRFVVSNFARQLAQIKFGKAPPEMHVGNLEAKRDFTDVRDIVRAYRLAAEKGEGVFNFASGESVSINSILENLVEISGLNVEIKRDPARMRPAEIPELRADISKARRELGWQPEWRLIDTLRDIYEYWLEKEKDAS